MQDLTSLARGGTLKTATVLDMTRYGPVEHSRRFGRHCRLHLHCIVPSGVARGRGFWGVQTPSPPEIPKILQNRAKLNPIVKTDKNC